MHQRPLLAIVFVLAGALVGLAHHPFATYDLDKDVTVTGDVVRAIYGEPHSFLHVREAGDGNATWIGELKGIGTLRPHGLTPATLKTGERVTLRGHPGRVASGRRLWVTSIARDGWSWSAP